MPGQPPLPSLSDSLAPVAAGIDALTPQEQVWWARGLSRGELRALYELAAAAPPLDLAYFHGSEGQIVRHAGQNSLPVFSQFEKRFAQVNGQVQGYNHNTGVVKWFAGPGHFTVRQDGAEVALDYTALPPAAPPGFPPLAPNDSGTARLVFGGMVDRMRRVSERCTIGAAYIGSKPRKQWFMLVKMDEPG